MTVALARQPCFSESKSTVPWRVGKPIDAHAFTHIRQRMLLDHCKWDPQVADVSTLTPFPLILRRGQWRILAHWAEQLTAELIDAESEICHSPKRLKRLSLPRAARRLLSENHSRSAPVRVMRFDFHWTTLGWQISEVNSDVPGGFTESSSFTQLIARHYDDADPAGDPAGQLACAIADALPQNARIALISGVGYLEDQQVIAYLARRLSARGLQTLCARPGDIDWTGDAPGCFGRKVDAIYRFFQCEWLAAGARRHRWTQIALATIPVINPVVSIISESKRFPLVWNSLRTAMPAWRKLLPVTLDPRAIGDQDAGDWVFKPAFCNTGDAVLSPAWMPPAKWRLARWRIAFERDSWIAQRRFDSIAADTPAGARYPCFGVYTVNGKACGIYGRLSSGRVVDFAASDVAVLIER